MNLCAKFSRCFCCGGRKVFCSCYYIDFALQSSKPVNWQKVSLTRGSSGLITLRCYYKRGRLRTLIAIFKWYDIISFFMIHLHFTFFYLTVLCFVFCENIMTEKRSWCQGWRSLLWFLQSDDDDDDLRSSVQRLALCSPFPLVGMPTAESVLHRSPRIHWPDFLSLYVGFHDESNHVLENRLFIIHTAVKY